MSTGLGPFSPYREIVRPVVTSTQDVALKEFDGRPLLVIASAQSEGRGRTGAEWTTAPRAVAATLALTIDWPIPLRTILPLEAGIAAAETLGLGLKWPNDLISGSGKCGGILVESRSSDSGDEVILVGIGLNLWWPDPPEGISALFDDRGEPDLGADLIRRWAVRLLEIVELGSENWPIDRYRIRCLTLGRDITWDPDGVGKAVDITTDGALVVETSTGRINLHSGTVKHIR